MDLPDDLELPMASGASWWYWLGGRPAIDFVNTHRERWWRNVETLVTTTDLSLWLEQASLLDGPADVTDARLRAARRLRAAIDAGIHAAIDHTTTSAGVVDEINRWLKHATPLQGLTVQSDGFPALGVMPPADRVHHALARIALDAGVLLGTEQRDRLRVCASETCSARFYDASRAAGRRWCSMAGCGNTAKARRHRARQRPRPPVRHTHASTETKAPADGPRTIPLGWMRSDADDLDVLERSEARVLGNDGRVVSQCCSRNPGVVAAQLPTRAQL